MSDRPLARGFLGGLMGLIVLCGAACGLVDDDRDEANKSIQLTFSDKRLEALCLEHYDLDGDGHLSRYEAQRVVTLDCAACGIASLVDLREFVNLRELDCSGNALTELDLQRQPLLERLDCHDNRLTRLELSDLRALTHLDCRDNALPQLDLVSNGSLAWLDCRGNLLRTLDLSRCAVTLQADVRDNPDLATVYYGSSGQKILFDGLTTLVAR